MDGQTRASRSALALTILLSAPTGWAMSVETTLLQESQYVSEGRDQLGDGGLTSLAATAAVADWSLGAWQAWGNPVHYRETNLSLEYAPRWGKWSPFVNVTYLYFDPADNEDREIAAGTRYQHHDWLSTGIETVWSHQAQGAFVTLSVLPRWPISDTLTLQGRLAQGLDYGYASPGHDGDNHRQLGLTLEWSGITGLTFRAGAHHSWAGEDVRRSGGGDESWARLGIQAYF